MKSKDELRYSENLLTDIRAELRQSREFVAETRGELRVSRNEVRKSNLNLFNSQKLVQEARETLRPLEESLRLEQTRSKSKETHPPRKH